MDKIIFTMAVQSVRFIPQPTATVYRSCLRIAQFMRGLVCTWYLERKQDRLELVTSISHGAMLTEVTVLKERPFRAILS